MEDTPETAARAKTDAQGARLERAADVALGLSSVSWAVLGLLHEEGPPLPARIGAAVVNLTVGGLFLFREPAHAHATAWDIARAIPSISLGAVAWRISGHVWPEPLAWAFLGLAIATALVLLGLGRSFAIFPARRTLRQHGPYAVVRHPLYAVELLLIATSAAAYAWWAALGLVLLGIAALVPRIRDEERQLAEAPEFAAYAQRVRYRLVPGIY